MTEKLTSEELERLEGLLAKATPGPWRISIEHGEIHVIDSHGTSIACDMQYYPWTFKHDDTALLVALRNAAPALIEAAREREWLKQQLAAAREARDGFDSDCDALRADLQRATEQRDTAEHHRACLHADLLRERQRSTEWAELADRTAEERDIAHADLRREREQNRELREWRDAAVASCAKRRCSEKDAEIRAANEMRDGCMATTERMEHERDTAQRELGRMTADRDLHAKNFDDATDGLRDVTRELGRAREALGQIEQRTRCARHSPQRPPGDVCASCDIADLARAALSGRAEGEMNDAAPSARQDGVGTPSTHGGRAAEQDSAPIATSGGGERWQCDLCRDLGRVYVFRSGGGAGYEECSCRMARLPTPAPPPTPTPSEAGSFVSDGERSEFCVSAPSEAAGEDADALLDQIQRWIRENGEVRMEMDADTTFWVEVGGEEPVEGGDLREALRAARTKS